MTQVSRLLAIALLAASGAAASAVHAAPPVPPILEELKKRIARDPIAAPALKKFAVETLLPESMNPVFIREAKAQNARKVPFAKIQELDKDWMAAGAAAPFKAAVLSAPASKEIQRVAQLHKAVREAFVMDDQGAVVGETGLTSDYWQGDEKKWTESYKEGRGGTFIDAAQFDASARVVLQQISLPLLDEGGKVVGAVTWGVVLDSLVKTESPADK